MKKWLIPASLCIAYSGTILVAGALLWELVERDILSKKISFMIFFLVIFGNLFTIVLYALKNSHRS